jgi:multidrug transporter EmrE-like cation transporter
VTREGNRVTGTILLALFSISLGAVGQFLLKVGVNRMGGLTFRRTELASTALKIVAQPHIVIGIMLFVLSMVVWLAVLSKMELSRAYPMVSISYVLVALMAKVFLGEHMSLMRMAGIAVILAGVVLVNL